ncbi:hypothetical protein NMY22_g2816 [Coprinellus aureogranulatus]|nr:hypothetical protein NMY22_g2816 [Coprinellus aureogranulatus]
MSLVDTPYSPHPQTSKAVGSGARKFEDAEYRIIEDPRRQTFKFNLKLEGEYQERTRERALLCEHSDEPKGTTARLTEELDRKDEEIRAPEEALASERARALGMEERLVAEMKERNRLERVVHELRTIQDMYRMQSQASKSCKTFLS